MRHSRHPWPMSARPGRARRVALAGALVAATLVVAAPASADACSPAASGDVLTFSTEGTCLWEVPIGVTSIRVDVFGAEGGTGSFAGGLGGQARARLAVTPGQHLQLTVGGEGGDVGNLQSQPPGAGGFNGGAAGGASDNRGGSGGGGASDVRWGTCATTLTCGLGDRVLVGGGGGGAGGSDQTGPSHGGNGGGEEGIRGADAGGFAIRQNAQGGGPGTQTQGGVGGQEDCSTRFNCFVSGSPQNPGANGTSGNGGAGGAGGNGGGGGGGGGYFGGGGGGAAFRGGGGGGGSGFVANAPGVSQGAFRGDTETGDGRIVINTDSTSPTVTVNQASGQADPTGTSPVLFTAVFSEPVPGFVNDVDLSGTAGATHAAVTEISPNDDTTYTISVSGMTSSGTVIAALLAGAATDGAGNPSEASTSTDNTVLFDATPPGDPTVTVDQASGQADPANVGPVDFTAVFSEPVTGLGDGDVSVSGSAGATTATVTETTPNDGTTYTISIDDMVTAGTVVASLTAGAAIDEAGNASAASTSTDNSVTFTADEDSDGIRDEVDESSTSSDRFSDVLAGGETAGSVVLFGATPPTILVEDHPETAKGVRVTVSGGAGPCPNSPPRPCPRAEVRVDGESGVTRIRSGSTASITKSSLIVETELAGPNEVELLVGGEVVLVILEEGEQATIVETDADENGTIDEATITPGDGDSITVNGQETTEPTVIVPDPTPQDVCSGAPPTGAIVGTPGKDRLRGTAGDDVVFGLGGDDSIDGRGGADILCGGGDADTLKGGDGADGLVGGDGNDGLQGGAGNDSLFGDGGRDRLDGGNNDDTMTGGAAADAFNGAGGNDTATDFNAAEGDTRQRVESF